MTQARRAAFTPVLVVGRGRVGRALAAALRRSLGQTDACLVSGRNTKQFRALTPLARTVCLAVPDSVVPALAETLAPFLRPGTVVLHHAGALGPGALAAATAVGAEAGVAHPLVSFANPRRPPSLAETTWLVDGSPAACRTALALARLFGARGLRAPVHGARYHAIAAVVANGAAALASQGVQGLVALGLTKREAEHAVAGLLASVAHNVASVGTPQALTGPIARGDAATVLGHRRAITHMRALARTYDAVAPSILETARAAGLEPRRARAVAEALAVRVSAAPGQTSRSTRRARTRPR